MRPLLFLILFLLMQGSSVAGWLISEESTDSFGNRLVQTTFIQNNLIRYETPSSIAIVDLNNKIITMIFSQYKVYWSGTTNDLRLNTIAIFDSQLEQMLIGIPEYKRKELDSIYLEIRQQLLDSSIYITDQNIAVIETDVKQNLLGYNAVKYNIVVDSTLIESIWHTTEVKPYDDIDIGNMISFMHQLNQGTGKGNISHTKEYLELLRSGMLLKSIEFSPDSNNYQTIVTNIREVEIVPDFFLPPKNYRKAALSDILNLMPQETNDMRHK